MPEQSAALNTTNGTSQRFQEVQSALGLRERLVARVAELERAEHDTVTQLVAIRTVLAELRGLLAVRTEGEAP